jgi:predicted alpha/beta hydrolase family esterase
MTKQVLFIQGGGEGAYDADAKLAASLRKELGPGYDVRYPRMPDEDDLDYAVWKQCIVEELAGAGDAILVGHSIGASVAAKFLAESGPKPALAGVFLIATPFWHNHKVWHWEEVELPKDMTARLPAGVPIFLYHGRNDRSCRSPMSKCMPTCCPRRSFADWKGGATSSTTTCRKWQATSKASAERNHERTGRSTGSGSDLKLQPHRASGRCYCQCKSASSLPCLMCRCSTLSGIIWELRKSLSLNPMSCRPATSCSMDCRSVTRG